MIFAYHADLSNASHFAKQSKLKGLGSVQYPNGYWRQWGGLARGWPAKDRWNGEPSIELDRFDKVSQGEPVWLMGYSDGAEMASYIATRRSEQVLGVVSYAGRMRYPVMTFKKFPVLILWNKNDKRQKWDAAVHVEETYDAMGHNVVSLVVGNDWTHWGGWDPYANLIIEEWMKNV